MLRNKVILIVIACGALPIPAATAQRPTCFGEPATLVGSHGRDRIGGTEGRDVIVGFGGEDHIDARGGNDLVCLGAGGDAFGDDVVLGDGGNDRITGGGGVDSLIGGPGADRLAGESGKDYLYGTNGDDVLSGGGGEDFLGGGSGEDALLGKNGADQFSSGRGEDRLFGGADGSIGDTVRFVRSDGGVVVNLARGFARTGAGRDLVKGIENIEGSRGKDVLIGDGKDNFIFKETGGSSVIRGRAGDDCVSPDGWSNRVSGGLGFDTYSGEEECVFRPEMGSSNLQGIVADLAEGYLSYSLEKESARIKGIESVIGTLYKDQISGRAGSEYLYGGPSNDTIEGRSGNDTLDGAGGVDTVDGGADTDECRNAELVDDCE